MPLVKRLSSSNAKEYPGVPDILLIIPNVTAVMKRSRAYPPGQAGRAGLGGPCVDLQAGISTNC
ncbi:hypothetical protein [Nitrospira sp. KM1]|uniref:hypothetical protein n=1 Tax=Nitrospira sp. KM1 TaxID=1936990 RepID=UPI0015660ACE|nr:hypothetical protein [Nitrospira sp. KM1]